MKKIIAFIVIVIGLATIVLTFPKPKKNNNNTLGVSTVSVDNEKIFVAQRIIVDPKITAGFKQYQVDQNSTALKLLTASGEVKTKGAGVMAFVTEINNRKADDLKKEFWAFYVNGKEAEVGAGSYQLKNGDKIEWKIEKY